MGVVVPSTSKSRPDTDWLSRASNNPGTNRSSALLRRDVRRSKANRLIIAINPASGVVRGPAGDILEQTNGLDPAIATEVKPVPRALGHADQVAGLHFDHRDRARAGTNVKQATA